MFSLSKFMANSANSCRQVRNHVMALSNRVLQNKFTGPNLNINSVSYTRESSNLAKARRLKKIHLLAESLQFICIVVDVGDSWIASHRVNLDPVSRKMFRNSIGYFDIFITIVCLVLTLRLMHFIKF